MRGGTKVTGNDTADRAKVIVFWSSVDGVGRSCTVANVALILASQGNRVLVADLDQRSPSLQRYLAAFLPEAAEVAKVLEAPKASPVHLTCEFEDPRGSVDFLGPVTDSVDDPDRFAVRREDLIQSDYDYILIDSSDAPPVARSLTEDVADVLILGYGLNKLAMDRAAQRARTVQRCSRGQEIRILPVAMRVDQGASGMTTRMRGAGRRQFAWLLADLEDEDRLQYWNKIEIPYVPDYAVEEGLPFLDGASDQRDRLVEAYVQLAAMLAPGIAPAMLGVVTDRTLARYRASRQAAAGSDTPHTIVHAGADRCWAEWLVAEFRQMGLPASRQRVDQFDSVMFSGGSLIIVVSENLLALPRVNEYLAAVASNVTAGGQIPLAVSIDESRLPAGQFPDIGYLPLAGQKAKETQLNLASYYEVSPSDSPVKGPRYPGTKVPMWNLPARPIAFHGRDNALDQIRDHFTSPAGGDIFALTGPPGIGKSQLAVEYAYRFATQYGLIFFIQASSVETVRAGLAKLADLTQPARRGDAPRAALEKLQSESAEPASWLLIYDGADIPANLADLMPQPGHGHVLVTSRTDAASWPAQAIVRPLDPRDADDVLLDMVPGMLPADARELAADLGEVPLALSLAAAWIRVTVQRLLSSAANPGTVTSNAVTEFRELLARAVDEERAAEEGEPDALHAAVTLLIELLHGDNHGAATTCLVETCAFLAPVGMSQRLLRSPEMLAQLTSVDSELADPVVLNNVLRVLEIYGLSLPHEIPRGPLQIHPVILEVVRNQLPPDRRTARAGAVVRMLAASAPLDMDEDTMGHADAYAELQQHLEASGAWRYTESAVRRWLVNQVRYLWQIETSSSWNTAVELGERLARHWAESVPDGEDDKLLLRLQTQLANVYRSRCNFARALALSAQTVSRQRRVLGVHHLRTLMTARGYGADLRLVGDFQGALLEDQSTWQAFSETLGDDHLMTIVASSNLALSELVTGEPEQALQRQDVDLDRCQRIASERPTQAAWILFHIGTLLRELGHYHESRDRLIEAKQKFDDLVRNGVLERTVWVVLRTEAGLSITERRLGIPSLERTEMTLTECRNAYGELYPDVLALELSRAGALHAENRSREAVAQAQEALEGYQAVFGKDHPFTWLCQVDLGIYALAADMMETAEEMSRLGWASMKQAFGPRHLWSVAASVARANIFAASGRADQALLLEDQALAEYRRRMGVEHPFTRTVMMNAAYTRLLLNDPDAMSLTTESNYTRESIELDAPPY
jgi:tetratricopeptide (TPR) repeat protein